MERACNPTALTVGISEDKVIVVFPQPVAFIGMTPAEARQLALGLMERADAIEEQQEQHYATRH